MDMGWYPDSDTYVEPDILVYKRVSDPSRVPASEVLLAIEIAVSSLAYDTGRKSEIYAALGVADYWVVNAATLGTRLHRGLSAGRYTSVVELPPDDSLVPLLLPPLAVKLADLNLG
jgi:Uma2 family endonuclease